MTKYRPLVIAHRGASGVSPENTLKAFQEAFKQKANGIELDVFLTCDGKVVVTHDEKLFRLTGVKGSVRRSLFSELRKLDFGEGEKIPTLDEVFKTCAKNFSVINVEIKSTGAFTDGIEKAVAQIITDYRLSDRIVVSSFNPLNLKRFKNFLPKVPIAYLIAPDAVSVTFHKSVIVGLRPDQLNLHPKTYENPRSRVLFHSGLPVWLWGADKPKDWEFAKKIGATGIITDHPGRLNKWLNAPAKKSPRKKSR